MADLHTRLLAELGKPYEIWAPGNVVTPIARMRAALLAVVERHTPEQHYVIGQDNRRTPSRLYCRECGTTSPCEEIQAIADQLGLTEGAPDRV